MTARRLLFVTTVALAAVVSPASPAGAIPNTCPTSWPDAGTVNIHEPRAGANFAGQVTVRGRASAAAGLSRVELFVGEALKDFQIFEPSRTDVEFLLRFDVASVQTSTATLSVVACGGAPGPAVRGIASIDVRVDRGAVTTTPPMALTPVERTDVRQRPGNRTGRPWVGAAFGLAGLVGLVAATRVRGSRAASASSGAGAGGRARPGRGQRTAADGAAPPRPSPARPPAARTAPSAATAQRTLGALGAQPAAAAGPEPAAQGQATEGAQDGAAAPPVAEAERRGSQNERTAPPGPEETRRPEREPRTPAPEQAGGAKRDGRVRGQQEEAPAKVTAAKDWTAMLTGTAGRDREALEAAEQDAKPVRGGKPGRRLRQASEPRARAWRPPALEDGPGSGAGGGRPARRRGAGWRRSGGGRPPPPRDAGTPG